MEYFRNELCIEANWLIEQEILTRDNYNKLAHRGQIETVRRGCRNTPALAKYELLPFRIKRQIEAKVGDPYKTIQKNKLEESVKADMDAFDFFSGYTLQNGRHLPANVQKEYYANAVVLKAIGRMASDRKAFVRSRGGRVTKLWGQMAELIMDLDAVKYPHTLPNNARRLQEKYYRYYMDGNESLIHRNFCNKSAAKVDDEVKESMLTELIGDPRNLDNEQIRALYNMVSEKMGWKKITASAVGVWREKLELVTHAGRRGGTDFMNTKAMQVKRSAPTSPLFFWSLDGWDVELLYQKRGTDCKSAARGGTDYKSAPARGEVVTYHNRLTAVVVLDPCVNYPIGYAIGTHETPELISAALRNAINHAAEIFNNHSDPSDKSDGKGYFRPHQLQTDHYAIKTMTPLYEAIAGKLTPARVKNAKAKPVEPYFHRINKKYCQLMPNWSGFGITSVKDNQPNVDFLNKYRHNFPDEQGCARQIEGIIALERAEKIGRYMELWEKTADENKLTLPWEQYLMLFGAQTGFKNMLQGSGMTITIEGIKRDYDCFDPRMREYASTRWAVRYDPEEPARILAINEDGTLRFGMEEKYVQPMALKDRKPGDYAQLERVRDYNKSLVESIEDTRAHTGDTVRELFEHTPALNETLAKLILVDSRGQHKDNKRITNYELRITNGSRKGRKEIAKDAESEEEIDIWKMM